MSLWSHFLQRYDSGLGMCVPQAVSTFHKTLFILLAMTGVVRSSVRLNPGHDTCALGRDTCTLEQGT